MQTFIISSTDIEKAREEALRITEENKVNKFDLETLEFEKSLGIEDVRNIQKNIFLKPSQGDFKATIIVIQKGATTEAQNSMLKLLEEPPISTLIFIVTTNHLQLLPTILSRAKLIEIKGEDREVDKKTLKDIGDIQTAGDALFLAQNLSKDKNEAIVWLENAILAAREDMIENLENKEEALRLRKLIHNLELAHYDLKNTNANTRLSLENLFLSLN